MVENSKISRRRVVVGTAWAAPAVLASTAVPAYAASAAVHCSASRITSAEANYHELVVPDGATYMRFNIVGGAGGMLDPKPPQSSATAGRGAQISGTFKVTPGQIFKIHLGSAGQSFGTRPAEGGCRIR